jgi:hypothetical protein
VPNDDAAAMRIRSSVRGTSAHERPGAAEGPLPRSGPDLRFLKWRGEDLNLRPSGYTYSSRLIGLYGLSESDRFSHLPGLVRHHPY